MATRSRRARWRGGDGTPAITGAPTFYGDAAPIFQAKCVGCHQTGGIAPFALDDYDAARVRAAQIADYTGQRIMAPYLVETGGACGSFDESVALSEAEIAMIGAWAAGGALEGTPIPLDRVQRPELEGGAEFSTPVPIPFGSNTRIRITCDYDTSRETAPVLPGWGTRNEMCYAMMMVALPAGS